MAQKNLYLLSVRNKVVAAFDTIRGADNYMADLKEQHYLEKDILEEDDFVLEDLEYYEDQSTGTV